MRAARFLSLYFVFVGVGFLGSALAHGGRGVYVWSLFAGGLSMVALGLYRIANHETEEKYPRSWGPLTYSLLALVTAYLLYAAWTVL